MTITQSRLQDILHYCQETGAFTWKARKGGGKSWNTKFAGKKIGWDHSNGYKQTCIDRKKYYLHRLAWFYVNGEWPSEIDHIDRDKTNNKISNLRVVSHKFNCQNRHQRGNPTGLKGVVYSKRDEVWYARITENGRTKHLGTFHSPEEAHSAYCMASSI